MTAETAARTESADNPRSAAPPRALIFDIGGVIVRVNVGRTLAGGGARAKQSPQQILSAIEADPLWPDWQEGKIDPHDWHRHLMGLLGAQLDFNSFRDAWNRVLDPEPIIGDELFRELGTRCRLALLSNTDPIHVAYMETNFSFMKYFPVRSYSCRMGMRKPAPEIFRRTLQELGVAAGEALYIDDIEENVQAAAALGMIGLRFTGVAVLTEELRRLGLLTE
jgi:glucose-1-phosphatase